MKIWLVEPYYAGSHRAWADGYQRHSEHEVDLLTLPGRFWKWRMHGGAITLARRARAREDSPDLVLVSDMLNLPIFLSLTGDRCTGAPIALYFHENQLTYPLRPGEKRDLHYGFIQFASALRADALFFNSSYHLDVFFEALPRMLKQFPDFRELWTVKALRAKSQVLPLGLSLTRLDGLRPEGPTSGRPLILWNHRWEYDKDPKTFFRAICRLAEEGLDFGLLLLGRSYRNQSGEFLKARQRWPERILRFGYAPDLETYASFLWQADIVVSTALHDFFGGAVAEACYCSCFPILPRDLAYPELIPAAYHNACLYSDISGLIERLRYAITHINEVRTFALQEHVARYDWRHMAPRYDNQLSAMIDAGASCGDSLTGASQ
jgi:glycosyltransferase involved in cell wall biosynthesis